MRVGRRMGRRMGMKSMRSRVGAFNMRRIKAMWKHVDLAGRLARSAWLLWPAWPAWLALVAGLLTH